MNTHYSTASEWNSRDSRRRAFTLIELLVVISIIGLLSSVILVALNSARDKGTIAASIEFADNNYHKLGVNIIGKWDFDNIVGGATIKDSSGNGYDLTLNGSAIISPTSPSGSGSSLYVSSGSTANFANASLGSGVSLVGQGSKGFTVSFWTKKTVVLSVYMPSIIVSFSNSATQSIYCINATGDLYIFSSDAVSNSPVCNDLGVWHQTTMSYDNVGNTLSVYLDGKQVINNASVLLSIPSLVSAIAVGNYALNQNSFLNFGGYIDDVAIYNELLTASAVQEIYAEGLKSHQFADR